MRKTRDGLLMEIAHLMAQRSTCQRLKVGCVITHDHRIISSGYNGVTETQDSLSECGCNPDIPCQFAIHAEANAIAFAARMGIKLGNCSIWLTHSPCKSCADLIIQSGISWLYYAELYRVDWTEYLENNGVRARQISH